MEINQKGGGEALQAEGTAPAKPRPDRVWGLQRDGRWGVQLEQSARWGKDGP